MQFRDLNPTKFMVAGDTHGNTRHVQALFKWAHRFGVDTIVQVGDFGFIWPDQQPMRRNKARMAYRSVGYDSGNTRLDKINRLAREAGITILWLDGNHEDFDRMAQLGAYPHSEEAVELDTNVIYLPRGFAWSWSGVRFMTMGGAYSIDHGRRIIGQSWWPEETIKTPDIYRAEEEVLDNGRVDVVFSHDAPELPAELRAMMSGSKILGMDRDSGEGYKLDRASTSNRVALTNVLEFADPSMVIHGHYHFAYYDFWRNPKTKRDVRVVGLDCDGTGNNSYIIFDTDAFKQDPTDHGE
jgi:hypothetical protein